jgi:hypothetical protein
MIDSNEGSIVAVIRNVGVIVSSRYIDANKICNHLQEFVTPFLVQVLHLLLHIS